MSVSGISSSSFVNYSAQYVQRIQQELQQLGTDLESGNLSAAQSDFDTLMPLGSQPVSVASTPSNNAIAQDFSQLGQNLQPGNLPAAQKDYTNFRVSIPRQASPPHRHHHHGGGGETSVISQLLQQLGQTIQSGNLSSAQTVFSTLQQDLDGAGWASGTSLPANSTGLSVTA